MNAIHTRQRSCDSVVFGHDSRTWYKKTSVKTPATALLRQRGYAQSFAQLFKTFSWSAPVIWAQCPHHSASSSRPFWNSFSLSFARSRHQNSPFRGSARKPVFHARATPVSLAGNMPRFVHRGDGEFEGKRGQAHVSRHGGWYLFVPRPTAFSSGFAVFLAGFLHGLRIIAYAFSEKKFTPHTTFFFFILASGEGASR